MLRQRHLLLSLFTIIKTLKRFSPLQVRWEGHKYSVSRDFPKEIVSARCKLMPMYKNERLKQNKKVSIEYPARMVVKGKTVYDQFPDWYPIMQQDRYDLASALNLNQDVAINYQGSAGSQTLDIRAHGQSVCDQAATQFQYNQGFIPANENGTTPIRPTPTYSEALTAPAQQETPTVSATLDYTPTHAVHPTVPRYTSLNVGNTGC